MAFAYVWEFCVRSEHVQAFEREYGPDGEWVRLFRRVPEYLGTELLRDQGGPGRYLTIDHWKSREACLAFRETFRVEFDAIDTRCEGYTLSERHIGDFDSLS